MDTNRLKKFATEARNILKAGIAAKLTGLGFDRKGEVPEILKPQLLQGGTLWNGQTFPEGFYHQWMRLYEQVQAKGVNEVYEQAAYTWFNRLVAIRILQKNGLCEPVSTYADSARTPQIVNQARQGLFPPMEEAAKRHLLELLDDDTKVTEQFAVLLVAWCHANPILQRCFGTIADYTELLLPTNILAENGFIDLLNHTEFITDEEFRSPELIGWLYQFYISERKDEVFAKKGKFEADEIPAATQIFTPNWIVKYMVQNTVGRIYLDNNPSATSMMKSKWQYLVDSAEPTPADAVLHYNELTDLKVADLACGSGHILNECFDLLYDLYIAEGYTRSEAITHIFMDNLTGIDLDPRAQQLSLFALTLKACQRDHSFADAHCLPRVLTMPKRLNMTEEELSAACLEFVGGYEDVVAEWLEGHLELMKDADSLGSIMKFDLDADEYAFYKVKYENWMQDGEEAEDIPVAVKQLLPSVRLILALSEKYDALVMNPPYMGSSKMNKNLYNYIQKEYLDGKTDLCNTFMFVGMNSLSSNGKMGMINMQSWMFQSSFLNLRKYFFNSYNFDSLLQLGKHFFEELNGDVVKVVSFICSKHQPLYNGIYFRLTDGKCEDKRLNFLSKFSMFSNVSQLGFESIPGIPMGYWATSKMLKCWEEHNQMSTKMITREGMAPADSDRFLRLWHEVSCKKTDFVLSENKSSSQKKWFPYNKGGEKRKWYGNFEYLVEYENDGYNIKHNYDIKTGRLRSHNYNGDLAFKEGVTWSVLCDAAFAVRYTPCGFLWDSAGAMGFTEENLVYYLGLLNSNVIDKFLRVLAPGLKFNVGDINRLPLIEKTSVEIQYDIQQSVYISKLDWDSHETSWDFQQNELISLIDCTEQDLTIESLTSLCSATVHNSTEILCNEYSGSLPVAQQYCIGDTAALQAEESPRAVRLQDLMERYHEKWSTLFMQLHANEEELNRQFIDIYGLQDELTPDVPLDEITILQQGEISIENE